MKLLFFKLRNVCYDSYSYFADCLMQEFQKLGYDTEVFTNQEPLDSIERFSGRHFDGIFDFNSALARATTEEDIPFLDTIDAPYIHIILDHPLYHHDSLKVPLNNYHVICLDENHKHYIETYYPHIKSVHVMEMTGEMAFSEPIPLADRKFDLLFTGTYTPLSEIEAVIENYPSFIQNNALTMLQQMKHDPALTLEETLQRLAIATQDEVIQEYFPLHMKAYFSVDSYLRSYVREQVIRTLLDAGIPVTVCGEGWERFDTPDPSLLSIGGSFAFRDTFRLMAQSRIILNVMPWFKAGSHDRIYSSLLNGCVTLTDTTTFLEKELCADAFASYRIDRLETLPELVQGLLKDPAQMQKIADTGFEIASQKHTWACRTKQLVSYFFAK